MKKLLFLLAMCALVNSSFAFDGVVSIQFKGNAKEDFKLTWHITDAKCRLDMLYTGAESTGKPTVFLPGNGANKVIMYNSNAATAQDYKYYDATVEKVPVLDNYKVTATNETKTIGGFMCVKYIFKSDNGKVVESWIAKDINVDWSNYAIAFRTITELQIMAKYDVKGFPLESTIKDASGVVTSYTLNYAKKETQAADLFLLPVGYSLNK